jgi:hypothetical protein
VNQPEPTPIPADEHEAEVRDDAVIGRALQASLAVFLMIAVVAAAAVWFFYPDEPVVVSQPQPVAPPRIREASLVEPPAVKFTNITESAGIRFKHSNGAYGEKLLPETMGGGCAWFDFDGDDDQDLLLVNSCRWPWYTPDGQDSGPTTLALYENDGRGNFRDVTAGSGLDVTLYGMGVAVGDYDNDGRVDVFISAVGPNRLFHNRGHGKFVDVTAQAGVAGEVDSWSTGCGFFDYDNDGDLDLFVCNYVRWSREIDLAQAFVLTGLGRAYGPPRSFSGAFPYLYRNDGDGKFADVSATAGVRVIHEETKVPVGKSLGVTFADIDRDGGIDILVANDTVQNFLFHNARDGTFREVGASAGIAFDSAGNARGAMGIDAARFRNDACLGVAIGNFANEMSALYVARAARLEFTDEAVATGLGPPTRSHLSFGMIFFDYDLDGRLDLLSANGHLEEDINKVQSSQKYRQSARLFWNAGPQQSTEFVAVDARRAGDDLFTPIVGRGAAYSDIDGDGDLDVLLTQIGGPPLLLRNNQQHKRPYLRLKLVGRTANRDAIGAWVEISGRQTISRQVMPTRSYLSQVELPVTIGISDDPKSFETTIIWPDGSRQVVPSVELNAVTVITQQPPNSGVK